MADRTVLDQGAFHSVVQFYAGQEAYLDTRLAAASEAIEDMCQRRFMPFEGLVESYIAAGSGPDVGDRFTPMPVGGWGFAAQLANDQLLRQFPGQVRDYWLTQYAPKRPELWTYSDVRFSITWPWAMQAYEVPDGYLDGPDPDTGHLRIAPGVMCPPGSRIQVTYSGGYTRGYPQALVEATRLECVRQLIVEIDPELVPALSTELLQKDIKAKIAPYVARG